VLWAGAALLMLVSAVTVVVLVQRSTWAGPALADGLRRVFGDRAVTRLEELYADAQDRAMRLGRRHARPRELEDVSAESAPPRAAHPRDAGPLPPPQDTAPLPTVANAPDAALPSGEPDFEVDSVQPPFADVAAPHDGQWSPVLDPERPTAPPLMFRTLIHPDPERSWAELFVVVLPLSRIELHVVAGTEEPESNNPDVRLLEPRGVIAAGADAALLAAFNGGFKARHGHHGMITGGVTIVPLRTGLCTISGDEAGHVFVRSWRQGDALDPGAWYRQTPPCMMENGVLHPGLANPASRKWGATLEGETVIRRSAIAIDREGHRLYVGISNFTTAQALALGMQSAGAWTIAQLDVNWSYPRILTFPRDEAGRRHAASLFKGFLFDPDEMLRRPSPRDFFYVLRR
jgi:hypothetical protein